MKRLSRFKTTASYVAVPFAAFAGQLAQQALEHATIPLLLKLSLDLVAVIVAFRLIEQLSDLLLNWPRFRRILLGNEATEGTWMDVVRVGGSVSHIGVLRFSLNDGELRVTGENFDVHGAVLSSFTSELVSVRWPVLRMQFAIDRPAGISPETIVFARLVFTERDGPPVRYKGYYHDTNASRGDFAGWKVLDPQALRSLDDRQLLPKYIVKMARQHGSPTSGGKP
jgi:hypothetical protein